MLTALIKTQLSPHMQCYTWIKLNTGKRILPLPLSQSQKLYIKCEWFGFCYFKLVPVSQAQYTDLVQECKGQLNL